MKTILIAPDKFKGSLSAMQAARAIQRGLAPLWPEAHFQLLPIADGGEGTARLFCNALNGHWVEGTFCGPLGSPVHAGYAWIEAPEPLAVIDMSAASGLAHIPKPDTQSALNATTHGTGEQIAHAMARGARRLIIGLGGSATTDGGAGMAQALGYRFENAAGRPISRINPSQFHQIERITPPLAPLLIPCTGACDVTNPLLGPTGAAAIFSPQKGALAEDSKTLETALSHLSMRVSRDLGTNHTATPGAGAAGGLGYGLITFLNASLRPGFELIAQLTGLEQAIASADLVITGEGSLDAQTLHGKGPAGIAKLAQRYGKPVAALGGRITKEAYNATCFDALEPLSTPPLPLAESIARAEELLEAAAARLAYRFKR